MAPSVTDQMDSGIPYLLNPPVSKWLKLSAFCLSPEHGLFPFPGLGTPFHPTGLDRPGSSKGIPKVKTFPSVPRLYLPHQICTQWTNTTHQSAAAAYQLFKSGLHFTSPRWSCRPRCFPPEPKTPPPPYL